MTGEQQRQMSSQQVERASKQHRGTAGCPTGKLAGSKGAVGACLGGVLHGQQDLLSIQTGGRWAAACLACVRCCIRQCPAWRAAHLARAAGAMVLSNLWQGSQCAM